MRVLKYLRGHIPAVALIVLLLVAQSFCEPHRGHRHPERRHRICRAPRAHG